MKMISTKTLFSAALVAGTMLTATPAFAQATRTWVSGGGDDVNPCSRSAPCKTFAGAISKTAAFGEINCLDPAGYGAVTITKSLTIDCHFTEGGVLATGNGIVVNAASTDTVVLRGLDIFGVTPPTNGVRIIAAAAVHIEECVIRQFNAANSWGISFQPGGATQLFVSNSTLTGNGSGSTGGGILVQPTGTGNARVVLDHVRILGNANNGLRVDSTGNTGTGISVTMHSSSVSGNGSGIAAVALTTSLVGIMVVDSNVSNNTGTGIDSNGANSLIRVNNTTITGNGLGVNVAGGSSIQSYGNNRNFYNPVGGSNNGAFSVIVPST